MLYFCHFRGSTSLLLYYIVLHITFFTCKKCGLNTFFTRKKCILQHKIRDKPMKRDKLTELHALKVDV
jgi:hypothetical protein